MFHVFDSIIFLACHLMMYFPVNQAQVGTEEVTSEFRNINWYVRAVVIHKGSHEINHLWVKLEKIAV